jgi:hypothetical protein
MNISRILQKALQEAPIQDLGHVGDFDRGSSFRHQRDRRIVTHPASIENIKKKFGNTKHNINILFVNTAKANRHTEHGTVDKNWIREELGDEVLQKVNSMNTENAITIIFTNNKGDQRIPMTPWIMAHRMMHVFARGKIRPYYTDAADELIRFTSDYVLPTYLGYDRKVPPTYDTMGGRSFRGGDNRKTQLLFKHLFHKIGTFKSARDKKLRDWFEVINEVGAQYLITGDVKFNEAPKCIGPRNEYCSNDKLMLDQANDGIDSMASYFKLKMDKMLDASVGKIFVM